MLGFVQNFFAPKGNPIGVDYGSDALRLAQVQLVGGEHRLVAAATADVPAHIRHDVGARLNFFVDTTRDLLSQGKFRGRQAVLGLPAANMFIQHLRMPKMDADGMKKALPWELRGKLPIDPSHALLRHIVAGDVYEGQEAKCEVIVMAAAKEMVNQLLAAASKARLDVVGMNTEPKALVDCFTQIYRRKSDEGVISCYVDIGAVATRATIACGTEILFARTIPVGGDHFSRAAAQGLSIKLEEAKILRVKIAQMPPPAEEAKEKPPVTVRGVRPDASIENSFALLSAGLPPERRTPAVTDEQPEETAAAPAPAAAPAAAPAPSPADDLARQSKRVEQACAEPLRRLVEELELCRRYYEMTFPQRPLERLIFVGGEARQKGLCQQIARQMGLAAQVGDPLVRVGKNSDVGVEAGIDRRQPQPGWAVAIGLSMGPAAGAGNASAAEQHAAAASTK
ncbi:MAG TPA: pilus assembly protein PilM [Tepidisphaeraceae bacterium]|nr:pilus assembly protein PilM [Tepidisphaeraceae bacterium]